MKSKCENERENETVLRFEERKCEGLTLKYYLSVAASSKVASYGLPLYSIRIELEGIGELRYSEARELFADGGKAVCFYDKLVKNLATPLDLKYIVEDSISG